MKKSVLFSGMVALLLVGCTNETQMERPEASFPIEFGTYIGNRQAITRAETTTDVLLQDGFGLFATYSTAALAEDAPYTPNFMYNQKVWNGGGETPGTTFVYTPVKYWPNETATDVLSFFAYGPYVENVAASGDNNIATGAIKDNPTSGITGITANNNTTTAPKVTYILPARTGASTDPAEVDLVWGVVPTGTNSWSNVTSTAVDLVPGKPYRNLVKPNTTQKIVLSFKHALAKVTFGTIALANDVVTVNDNDNANAATNTSIVVSEITLSGKGIAQGVLNLNNTTANVPLWESTSGEADFYTKVSGDQLATGIKDAGATATQPAGVTKTATAILASGATAPGALLIPSTSQSVTVTIKYYTVTKDANLLNGESRVENVISKTLTGLELAGSKAYKINIVIGITSIKVDATVDDWDNADPQVVDLPANIAS